MPGSPEQFGYPVGEDGCINFMAIRTDFIVESTTHYEALRREFVKIIKDYDNQIMPILILNE